MATIQQLWNFGGRLGHLKIRRRTFNPGSYLEVMDIRNGTVLAWLYREGQKAKACDTYSPDMKGGVSTFDDWEIYKDPPRTRKVTLYACIVKSGSFLRVSGANKIVYERSEMLVENETEGRELFGDNFVKLQEHAVTTIEVSV